MSAANILVVEDGPAEREALVRVLRMEKYAVLSAENPQQAISHINEPVDLVVSDLRMGKNSGLDLLRYWKGQRPATPFIMVTAYGDVDSAVAAIKLGAKEYLTKPVDPDALLRLIGTCLQSRPAQTEALPRRAAAPSSTGLPRVVGKSSAMIEVCDQTCRAAHTESTILILGESGTGKELIAEAIHENSLRQARPFVLVNMAAIPDTLVESELFGHVKGAFTSANADRIGRFETANGGTIFIDEIGDFPAPSQAKLLRVLENRTISRIGSSEDKAVNVRVVAATSRNLREMVARGEFREDLYYRLNVVVIQLPPLRERREDIPILAEFFLREQCRNNDIPELAIEPALLDFLENYDWPGNVRQLRNCLESMVVLAGGSTLTLDDLPISIRERTAATPGAKPAADRTLDEMERTMILRTLKQFDENRTRAAEALGISVRTLQRRLKDWGMYEEPPAGN